MRFADDLARDVLLLIAPFLQSNNPPLLTTKAKGNSQSPVITPRP